MKRQKGRYELLCETDAVVLFPYESMTWNNDVAIGPGWFRSGWPSLCVYVSARACVHVCVRISSQPQSLFWELTCCNPHESLRSSFACYTAQKKLTLSLSPTLPCSVNHEWIPVFAPLHTLHARCETAKCLESQMKYQVWSNLEIGSSGLTAEAMLSVGQGVSEPHDDQQRRCQRTGP